MGALDQYHPHTVTQFPRHDPTCPAQVLPEGALTQVEGELVSKLASQPGQDPDTWLKTRVLGQG